MGPQRATEQPPDPGRLLAAVRAARLSALPTPRRVRSRCLIALESLAVTALLWLSALDPGGLLLVAIAAASSAVTAYHAARAWQTATALRRREPAPDPLDHLAEHPLTGAGDAALQAVPAVLGRDWGDLTEVAGEIAAEALATRLLARKPRQTERLERMLPARTPGEPPPLVCRGMLRLLRPVVVALTADGLCVYRYRRRRPGELLAGAPLGELRVLEWFRSLSPLEARHRVLILAHGDRRLRLGFALYWHDEAQLLFDVLYARDLAERAAAGVSAPGG